MLTDREEALLKIVDGIYDAGMGAEPWSPVLKRLANWLDVSGAYVFSVDMQNWSMPFSVLGSDRVDPASEVEYQRHYYRIDPRGPLSLVAAEGETYSDQSLASNRDPSWQQFQNEFLLKYDVPHTGGVVLEQVGSLRSQISLVGSAAHGPFDRQDLQPLVHLQRHLRRALGMQRQLARFAIERELLISALDQVPCAAIVLDSQDSVSGLNQRAQALLARKDGIVVRSGCLSCEDPAANRRLRAMIARAVLPPSLAPESAASVVQVRRPNRRPYTLQVMRLQPSAHRGSAEPGAVLVLVSDPETQAVPREVVLQAVYGLTPAECRVAAVICRGLSVKEVAGELGISVLTARTHVKHLLAKTGSRSQAALVREFLTGPAGMGAAAPRDDSARR